MNLAARSLLQPMIEPLESRIAPARVIFVGAPDLPNKGDTNYGDAIANDGGAGFVRTTTAGDPISDAVDPTHTQANHYYLRLSKGDRLELYTGQDHTDVLLSVSAGNVVAFFNDNGDGEVQQTELVSLALGKDAAFTLKSGVAGDIVTNLSENGTADLADDTLNMTDLVSAKQGIKGALIGGGAVTGKILSGGNVSNVTINGGVQSILVGSAAFNQTFDFFPGAANGGDGVLTGVGGVQPGVGQDGGSIFNVTLNDDLFDRVEAGGGGFGAKGGSLSQIVLTTDTTGFTLKAGKGGDAGLGKTNGGNGGTVQNVFIAGRSEDPAFATPNSLMSIMSGAGGVSGVGLGGKGGSGGALSKVYVGFELAGKTIIPSTQVLIDDVQVISGAGGAGKTGGAGGAINTVRAIVTTPNGAVVGDEIQVIGGAGGDSNVATGKTGAGATITGVDLRNLAVTSGAGAPGLNASILVQAGAAGVAAGAGGAAKGGSVLNATFLGADLRVVAGDGSGGKSGGDGGFAKNIVILEGDNVLAHNASVQMGRGGAGAAGSGGKGGDLLGLRIDNGDFAMLDINPGGGGRGGDGVGGKGGRGGLVQNIIIDELDSGGGFAGTFNVNSGIGGSGTKGGGDGGAINLITFASEDMNAVVNAGSGGAVLAGGKGGGGNGGLISAVQLSVSDLDPVPVDRNVTIQSGDGGAVMGISGKGGRGGDLKTVNVRALGSVSLTAGKGGDGVNDAAGKGGDLLSSAGFATNGTGLLQAGDAGTNGTKAGKGGSILGGSAGKLAGIYAAQTVTVQAGNGTHGGEGGAIKFLGYGSTPGGPVAAPAGTIIVQAGNGSAEGKNAGKGGSIDSVFGSVTTGAGLQTLIAAGIGGGNADKQADGGSITNLSLFTGGAAGAEVLIDAGDAGPGGANVGKGAKGGSVNGVQISGIDPAAIIRHIAAGKGGDALGTGGQGGSLNEIRVLGHDIGVRQGAAYGFSAMGGLFAGAGGAGAVKGVAGSVTNVTATAIAAIVAGKGATPEEATLVEFITVGTPTNLLKASEGDLIFADGGDPNYHGFQAAAYATNNLVGAVMDPTAVDGNKFHFVDANANNAYDLGEALTDGLIVAKVFNQTNCNFTPEAKLIGGVFYDYDNLV